MVVQHGSNCRMHETQLATNNLNYYIGQNSPLRNDKTKSAFPHVLRCTFFQGIGLNP